MTRLYYGPADLDRAVAAIGTMETEIPSLSSRQARAAAQAVFESADLSPLTGQTSDGFHTFDELYRYRMLYNAALFNAWDEYDFQVHKSRRHHDGEYPFGDPSWFIVVAQLPAGQISNHYRVDEAWDLFRIPEEDRASKWDGHTPAEAADRLERLLRGESA